MAFSNRFTAFWLLYLGHCITLVVSRVGVLRSHAPALCLIDHIRQVVVGPITGEAQYEYLLESNHPIWEIGTRE